jgi:hypothetical protein
VPLQSLGCRKTRYGPSEESLDLESCSSRLEISSFGTFIQVSLLNHRCDGVDRGGCENTSRVFKLTAGCACQKRLKSSYPAFETAIAGLTAHDFCIRDIRDVG